jgi:transposase
MSVIRKKGKKNRKHGRDSRKPKKLRYERRNQRERNKLKRIRRSCGDAFAKKWARENKVMKLWR